jgi:hypothetical protein
MIGAHSARQTATLLLDGRVLVAGGQVDTASRASAELYDPSAGTWTATGDLQRGRVGHTATLLLDGKVLVVAGDCMSDVESLASAELYDPASGTWTPTGPLPQQEPGFAACVDLTATRLSDGRVLAVGGSGSFPDSSFASASLYDPRTGTWTATGSMRWDRHGHTATLLLDGRVLVAGGGTPSGPRDSAELYDPESGTWAATGSMAEGHHNHTATLLLDGRLLVVGGSGRNVDLPQTDALLWAELYDPGSGSWSAAGGMVQSRSMHTATLLLDGRVLVVGGPRDSAELYDPGNGSWSAAGSMAEGHQGHTATRLLDGRVLVAGGYLASAELYHPSSVP